MTTLLIPYSVLLFILSLSVTIFSLSKIIPLLRGAASQPIYSEGPSWHQIKSGTPTMGGIVFLFTFILSSILTVFLISESEEVASIALLSTFSVLNVLLTQVLQDVSQRIWVYVTLQYPKSLHIMIFTPLTALINTVHIRRCSRLMKSLLHCVKILAKSLLKQKRISSMKQA